MNAELTAVQAAIRDAAAFTLGGCGDTCVGTLLLRSGMKNPEDVVFKDIRLWTESASGADGSPIIHFGYRNADCLDYLGEIAAASGLEATVTRNPDLPEPALLRANAQLAEGRPVVAFIDHYTYPHSPFSQQRHFRHAVVLMARVGDHYVFRDPLPSYDATGSVASEELARWMSHPGLGQFRHCVISLAPAVPAPDDGEYLSSSWRRHVDANIEHMLDTPGQGVSGLELMADRLPDLVAASGDALRVPADGPLEIGRHREGHARYLERLSERLGDDGPARAAEALRRAVSSWNLFSSVRQLTMIDGAAERDGIRPEFIRRQIASLAAVLAEVAAAEKNAMQLLRAWRLSTECGA